MKQLRFLLVAMMTVVNTVSVHAQEAYAVVTMEHGYSTSVAFYYDTNKSSFVGTGVTIVDDLNAADVYSRWTSTALTSVTFDASFKNYTGLTSLYRWFYCCSALTEIDLSNLNVTNVTRCDEMFYYCSNLETIYAAAGTDWSTGRITISSTMFNFCSKLVGGALTPYHQNAVNIDYAHIDGGPGNPGYFTDPEAPMAYAAVTMNADNKPTAVTFYYDKQKDMHQGVTIVRNLYNQHSWAGSTLTSATFDESFADFSTLTNLSFWFNNCSALASISGLEYLNTSNVTTMQNMFSSCTSLTELDLTGFDISNLVNTNQMFYGCSNLDAIYATGNWATDKITDSSNMFGVCNMLVGSAGTVYDSSGGSDKSRAHVDGGPTNPGYFSQRGVALAYAAVENNADGKAVAVTFYYDTQKDNRAAEGKTIVRTLNSSTVYQNWAGYTNGATLTSATFDQSFKNYTGLISLYRWFESCKVLTSITGLENLSIPNVTTTNSMFSNCSAMKELDLRALNTSSVTDMSYMFSSATNLQTIYVGDNWTIAADANTSSMFLSSSALVGGRGTLYNSSKTDGTMAHIDGGVADPGYLSRKGDPVAYTVVTKNADSKPVAVTFYYDTQKDSRAADNTTIVTRLNSNVAYKEWADVTLTSATFDPSFASYHDLTSLYQWFYYCSALTGITGLEYLNTENVTTMYQMFNYCGALTELDLTHFDVTKVQNTYQMFAQCTSLETIYAATDWNTVTNTQSAYMFYNCPKLMGGAMTAYDASHTDMAYAHPDGGIANPGYFTDPTLPRPYAVVTKNADSKPVAVAFYYDTNMDSHRADNVTILRALNGSTIAQGWKGATLTSVTFDDSFANFHGLTTLNGWFSSCTALTSIDLSNLNTENVTTMQSMFYNCSGLTELDISGFDMGKVTNAQEMFYNCSNLETIYVPAGTDWTGTTITNSSNMFGSCQKLVGGYGTVYNYSFTDKSRACIDTADKPGYFTDRTQPRPYAVLSSDQKTLNFYYDTQLPVRKAANPEATFILKLNNSGTTNPAWATAALTTVTFDASLKNYTGLTALSKWFSGCTALTAINGLKNLNTANVTTMYCMFYNCISLAQLDLSSINTANVTTMYQMLYACKALTQLDLSSFNTGQVTTMYEMFRDCQALQTITFGTQFTTAKVTTMNNMFYGCSALTELDLSTFTTEVLTNAAYMFSSCGKLQTIYAAADADWTGATLTSSYNMFSTAVVGGYGTLVTSTDKSYARIDKEGQPGYFTDKNAPRPYAVLSADQTTVTFYYDTQLSARKAASENAGATFILKLNNNDSYGNTAWASATLKNVTFDESFANYKGLTKLYNWFKNCSSLTEIDLSNLNVTNVTSTYDMFYGCSKLETIYAKAGTDWNTETLTNSSSMFYGCTKLVGGNGTPYYYTIVDKTRACIDGLDGKQGYFTNPAAPMPYAMLSADKTVVTFFYDTEISVRRAATENVGATFVILLKDYGDDAPAWATATLTSVTFDTSFADCHSLTRLKRWFANCTALMSIDLSNLNTENVTTMYRMFYNCSGLTELDLSGFDMGKVTNAQEMFYNCSNLETIYAAAGADWNTETLNGSSSMFSGCSKLVGGYGTAYTSATSSTQDKTRACIDVEGTPGYFTDKNAPRPYAVVTKNADSQPVAVAFYYDTQLAQRKADNPEAIIVLALSNNSSGNSPSAWADQTLTSVVFDDSFATYKGLTGLANWFKGCSALTELDLTNLNTENVTSMGYMFNGCSALTELDLSGFNTGKVTNANWMFSGCSNLATIYAASGTSWNTETLTDDLYMFQNCNKLVGGNGTTWNSSYITKPRACIDGLDGNPGYFTDKNAPRPYAILSADYASVSFYYDTQLPVRKAATPDATVILKLSPGSKPVWATSALTSATFDASFAGFTGITSLYMYFEGCTGLTAIDLSNLNAANVTTTYRMFYGCSNLENITFGEHFTTDKVTTMHSMFYGCSKLETITFGEHFTTANVTEMTSMFSGCMSLTELDLSTFTVEKLINTDNMFYNCANLEIIYAAANADWNASTTLTSSTYMFQACSKLIGGCGTYYENNWNGYSKTRARVDGLNGQPGYFTDRNAPRPYAILSADQTTISFYYDKLLSTRQAAAENDGATFIIRSLSNTSNVTKPDWATAELTTVNFDDSFAGYTGLTALIDWFNGCTALSIINGILNLNTSNVTSMYGMFNNCSSLTQLDLSGFNTSNVTSMYYMFFRCSSLTGLNLSSFNTGNVKSMNYMFYNCSSLTELDLSSFNTSNVTSMNSMFSNCTNLQTITFGPQFTTANVTDMSSMFSSCPALTELDLTTFTVEKLTTAYAMFQQCLNLKTIYAKAGTDWNTDLLTSSSNMFNLCSKLVGGNGTGYNNSFRDKTYARIDGLNDNPGYFTDPEAFLLGDVNKDGSITIDDVTALVSIILGKDNSGTYDKRAADVNKDSTITIADVTALVNIILEKQ
ncbi:MAG: BspA family leucine-rich repeat surface protein [Prevotella sp.]|nr:BspA family leucine-rich repeat surface protein [Prevotella sp.]